VKTVGAGACSQRASRTWRGGVSSMLGASWVDEHSIAGPAAQHNQLLHALLLAADRSSVGVLCGFQRLRPLAAVAASTAARRPASRRCAGDQFACGELQRQAPAVVAAGLEMEQRDAVHPGVVPEPVTGHADLAAAGRERGAPMNHA